MTRASTSQAHLPPGGWEVQQWQPGAGPTTATARECPPTSFSCGDKSMGLQGWGVDGQCAQSVDRG